MKKLGLLVMPLMAISFLFSCGSKESEDEKLEFSISEISSIEDQYPVVSVDWNPSDHRLEFISCSYTCDIEGCTANFMDQPKDNPRPMHISITIKGGVTKNIEGTLRFTYKDITAGKEGEESLKFIIPVPTEPTY